MARARLEPNADNATISELKETGRVGSSETALRCTAIQFLLAGTSRQQVCAALEVTERALQKRNNNATHFASNCMRCFKTPN